MGTEKIIPVVLDTNVIISALLFGGTPGKLIHLRKTGTIQPFISKQMVDELLKVLTYPKFALNEAEIHYLLYAEILPYFEVIKMAAGPVIIESDPSDDIFLRCAVAASAAALITGDKHLLTLKSFEHIPVLTPSQFLRKFQLTA